MLIPRLAIFQCFPHTMFATYFLAYLFASCRVLRPLVQRLPTTVQLFACAPDWRAVIFVMEA